MKHTGKPAFLTIEGSPENLQNTLPQGSNFYDLLSNTQLFLKKNK